MLYMESRVMEDGGYSAVMSFNTETNDCAWSQSNHVGRFLGSSEKPDDFEIFKEHGRKVSLKKGITGYLYETGRGDANVQWEYQGTFYLVGDLPLSDAVAIEMANAAIENTQ